MSLTLKFWSTRPATVSVPPAPATITEGIFFDCLDVIFRVHDCSINHDLVAHLNASHAAGKNVVPLDRTDTDLEGVKEMLTSMKVNGRTTGLAEEIINKLETWAHFKGQRLETYISNDSGLRPFTAKTYCNAGSSYLLVRRDGPNLSIGTDPSVC